MPLTRFECLVTSMSVDVGFAAVKVSESFEDFDGCGFACAIGSEHSEDLSVMNLERDAVNCDYVFVAFAEVADLDDSVGIRLRIGINWRFLCKRHSLNSIERNGRDRVSGQSVTIAWRCFGAVGFKGLVWLRYRRLGWCRIGRLWHLRRAFAVAWLRVR